MIREIGLEYCMGILFRILGPVVNSSRGFSDVLVTTLFKHFNLFDFGDRDRQIGTLSISTLGDTGRHKNFVRSGLNCIRAGWPLHGN